MREYYISDHAVINFQERVAFVPSDEVRSIINTQINKRPPWSFVNWDRCLNPVYKGEYNDLGFYIIMKYDEDKKRDYIATILNLEAKLQTRYVVKKN